MTPAIATTSQDIQAQHEHLARFVHANFHRRLGLEDARDAAANALIALDRAQSAGIEISNVDGWLRRAAWRDALDQIRAMRGEAAVPRETPVDIDDFAHVLAQTGEEDPSDGAGRAADKRALERTWSGLKPDEQRAIRLRYYDELPVSDVLDILGCSRHHYENLTKRALRKLREALVQTVEDSGCRACRALTLQAQDQPLLADAAVERDAHLAGCLACRAFARRQAGLMAALPLPAAGFVDRISAYVGARFGSGPEVAQTGEVAAGATIATGAGASAVGGGTTVTGLLGGAGAAKVVAVVCGAGAVTAAVCVPQLPQSKPDRQPSAKVARAKPKQRDVAIASPKPAVAVAAAAQVTKPTADPSRSAAGTKTDAAERKPKQNASETPPDASPFLPESAADPEPPAPQTNTPSAAAASGATTQPAPATKTSSAAATPASADFSQEFTP